MFSGGAEIMPYKDLEMIKEIKRLNYLKNSTKIKKRMERNRRKRGIKERVCIKRNTVVFLEESGIDVFVRKEFTQSQIENQRELIKNSLKIGVRK